MLRQCRPLEAWDGIVLLRQCTDRNVGGTMRAFSEKRPLKKSLALRRTSLAGHSLAWPGERRFVRSSMEWRFVTW